LQQVQEKYQNIKSAIQVSKAYLDRLEFDLAEQNMISCLDELGEEDKSSPYLLDVLGEAKELARKSQENRRIKDKYDTYVSQGQSADILERYDDAIQAFSSAILEAEKLNIDARTIRAHIGIIQRKKQDYEDRVKEFLSQANAALAVSDFDKVDDILRQVPEKARQLPEYRSLQNRLHFDRQEMEFTRYCESGSRYLLSGDYQNAIKQFEEARRLRPDDAKAEADLYEARYNQNLIDQKESEKLVEEGDRELAKGDLLLAGECYRKALAKNEGNSTSEQKSRSVQGQLERLRGERRRNMTLLVLGIACAVLIIVANTYLPKPSIGETVS
jgi:tetratricopeptide (TPR) repeat protein